MSRVSIQGMLPVPIKVNGVSQSKITMVTLTMEEQVAAITDGKEGQYVAIADLVACTKWGDDLETATPVTYEQLAGSSAQNRRYLVGLREQLEAKEREAAQLEPQG